MIDYHSHILPGMDDGSRSIAESLQMLEASALQGITHIAATSHFYPMENSPEEFLLRRERAALQLQEAWHPGLPQVLLGAEVYYFEGISRVEALKSLRIEGTPLLLLEMPFQPWTNRMVNEVIALNGLPDFTVLLAHIERYLWFQKREVWVELLEVGVLMQSNASFFLHWSTRHKAVHMLKSGQIHLLGSDCHNMESRAPCLGAALKIIGESDRQVLERRSRRLAGLEEAVN